MKIKNICEQFQEVTNKILTSEDEGDHGEAENLLDPAHLVNTYDGLMKQLKKHSNLANSVIRNSIICGIFSLIFFAIDVTSTVKRKALDEEMNCTVSNETWTCIFPLSDHTFWVGILFSFSLGIEIISQIVSLVRQTNKHCEFETLYDHRFGERINLKHHSDLFHLYGCLKKVNGKENALLVLLTVDKTVRNFWKDVFIFKQETFDHNPFVSLSGANKSEDKDILKYLNDLESGNSTMYVRVTNEGSKKQNKLRLSVENKISLDDKQNVFNYDNNDEVRVLNVDVIWKRRKIFTDILEYDGLQYSSKDRDVSLISPVLQGQHAPAALSAPNPATPTPAAPTPATSTPSAPICSSSMLQQGQALLQLHHNPGTETHTLGQGQADTQV